MAKLLALLCCVFPALAARAEGFGAEAGAGFSYGASEFRDAIAPVFSLRGSYGARWLSAGVPGLLYAGIEASYRGVGKQHDSSGLQAAAALADLSIHTSGTIAVGVRFGAGVGKVISLNCNCE